MRKNAKVMRTLMQSNIHPSIKRKELQKIKKSVN
jgi:hypothetical protein